MCSEWKLKLTKTGLYSEKTFKFAFFLDAFLATWHLVFTRHGYLGPFRDFTTPCSQDWCTQSGVPNAPPKMQAGSHVAKAYPS